MKNRKPLSECLKGIDEYFNSVIPAKNFKPINEISNRKVLDIIDRHENKSTRRSIQRNRVKSMLINKQKMQFETVGQTYPNNIKKIVFMLLDNCYNHLEGLKASQYETYCEILDMDEDEVIMMYESFTNDVLDNHKKLDRDDYRNEMFNNKSVLKDFKIFFILENNEIFKEVETCRDYLVLRIKKEGRYSPEDLARLYINQYCNILFESPRDARKFLSMFSKSFEWCTGYKYQGNYHDFMK